MGLEAAVLVGNEMQVQETGRKNVFFPGWNLQAASSGVPEFHDGGGVARAVHVVGSGEDGHQVPGKERRGMFKSGIQHLCTMRLDAMHF